MKTIHKIAKNLFIEGNYEIKDPESNYAYPVDHPTVFVAYGEAIRSGNWMACTAINTPRSIHEFYNEYCKPEKKAQSNYDMILPNLTESEKYEFFGLVDSIAKIAEAYSVFRFGNHGTSKGTDIKNIETAKTIFETMKPAVNRANELLNKIGTF
jgi:hypothetical protein